MARDSILEQALSALQTAPEDPDRGEQLAAAALAAAVDAGLAEAQSVAYRALGLAARARHQIPLALVHLRASVAAAERAAGPDATTEARISLAATLVLAGDSRAAITVLDGAKAVGPLVAEVDSQRAMILTMLGRYEEALRAFRTVIPILRRHGDPVRHARALNNRGLLHTYTGRFAQAETDLSRAEQMAADEGNATEAARYRHNRGFAAARRGDLPVALALFDEADARCRALGVQSGARLLDRAGVLQAAGLVGEARATVEEALAQLRDGGNLSDLAEGLVLMADIALLGGDHDASRSAAEEAAELFGLQTRGGWRALARAAVARAALSQGEIDAPLAELAAEAAGDLDAMGLANRATMAHAVAGRLWLACGNVESGLEELERAGSARQRGGAAGRLAAWEAEAVARASKGDRRGAMAAVRRALAVVDDQQASVGATELRVHIAIHAGEMARLGLRLAVETKQARSIWPWMERYRANSIRRWPARPPRDEVLAGLLSEIRGVAQDIASLAVVGEDPGELLVRQTELEREVRERAWRAVGPQARAHPARPADVRSALAGAALVELADVDGYLHAVVVAGDRTYHRRLAPVSEVHRELSHVRMALRRLAYRRARPSVGVGAPEQLARAAGTLDRLLMAPLARLVGSRPVVVVPTAELHAVPWATLPTLVGRPVCVAPSARLWLEATVVEEGADVLNGPSGQPGRRAPGRGGRTVIVAGPDLPGAVEEATTLGGLYPTARVLTGPEAHVRAVTEALDGAGLAHIAAHASFRADNGLWSSLELADGRLTVYELEQLRQPPQVVVLSACQSGLSAVHPGNEVMGLVAGLLALGARSVVASVVPVDDEGSGEWTVGLHRHLRAGERPAAALARVQASSADPASLSYVCFGGS